MIFRTIVGLCLALVFTGCSRNGETEGQKEPQTAQAKAPAKNGEQPSKDATTKDEPAETNSADSQKPEPSADDPETPAAPAAEPPQWD